MKLMELYKKALLEAENDYRGQHKAPGKDDAPLHDLTTNGIYPDDVYSNNAIRYYGTGIDDNFNFAIIRQAKGKPNLPVTIYRSMPNFAADPEKKQKDLTTLIQYVENFGFAPLASKKLKMFLPDFFAEMRDKFSDEFNYDKNKYLDFLYSERKKYQTSQSVKSEINPGDWVTLSKKYAKDHMEGEKDWKVVSKKVKASELYTDGNSWDEWGWNP